MNADGNPAVPSMNAEGDGAAAAAVLAAISSENAVDEHTKPVTLLTVDGKQFEVKASIAVKSKTIRHMMEDDCANDVIPISNVDSKTFIKILEYCEKHDREESMQVEGSMEEESKAKLKEWDFNYINVHQQILFRIFMAANYLEIQGLLELCAEETARRIRGKTVEEIRKAFDIKNDFTPEEEEAIRKENSWAFK